MMTLDQAVKNRDEFRKSLDTSSISEMLKFYNDAEYETAKLNAVNGGPFEARSLRKFESREVATKRTLTAFAGYCQIVDLTQGKEEEKMPAAEEAPRNVAEAEPAQCCPQCGRPLSAKKARVPGAPREKRVRVEGEKISGGLKARVGTRLIFPGEIVEQKGNFRRQGSKAWACLQSVIDNPGMTYDQYVKINDTDPRYVVADVNATSERFLRGMLGREFMRLVEAPANVTLLEEEIAEG